MLFQLLWEWERAARAQIKLADYKGQNILLYQREPVCSGWWIRRWERFRREIHSKHLSPRGKHAVAATTNISRPFAYLALACKDRVCIYWNIHCLSLKRSRRVWERQQSLLTSCSLLCIMFHPPTHPHVNQQGTHLPVNTAAVILSRSSLLWHDFSYLCLLGCLKIPCNDENIAKLWEGLFRLLIGGRGLEMMPERSGVRQQLFPTSVSLLTHHFRLPHVGLASKIEVTRAADGNLVHSEVKDMYMGHVCML